MRILSLLLFAATLISCGGGQQCGSQVSGNEVTDKEVRTPMDFSSVWMAYQDNILGYIGKDYERFYLLIDSIKADAEDTLLYHVWGKYRIDYNIENYEGEIRVTDISKKETHFSSEQPHHDCQIYNLISKWELKDRGEGTITGQMVSSFFILDGKAVFDDINLGWSDSYCNNQFTGIWTSKENEEQKCRWGTFRIPDSGDLDIGAGEFSPADKYLKNGWWSYRQALLEGTEEGWEYEKRIRWSMADDYPPYIPVQIRPFVRATEKAPEIEKELLAGFRFGMNNTDYKATYDKLERIECDQVKLVINNTYFQASAGNELFSNGKLYYKHFCLNYKGVRGEDLTKADFDSLATYFKGIYGEDSLHYMYTEMPISEFPTHHWRKDNLYFCLSWFPEGEIWNLITLEYINGPAYWVEMKKLRLKIKNDLENYKRS